MNLFTFQIAYLKFLFEQNLRVHECVFTSQNNGIKKKIEIVVTDLECPYHYVTYLIPF